MKLEWMLLAEGLGQDARGAVTAIGINQNVLVVQKLPITTKRAIIAHIEDEDNLFATGDKLGFRFRVISPSDDTISTQSGQVLLAERPHSDLPFTIDFPVEIVFDVAEYGPYRLTMTINLPDGEQVAGQVILYVKEDLASSSTAAS
jgi:hypothetical protein